MSGLLTEQPLPPKTSAIHVRSGLSLPLLQAWRNAGSREIGGRQITSTSFTRLRSAGPETCLLHNLDDRLHGGMQAAVVAVGAGLVEHLAEALVGTKLL